MSCWNYSGACYAIACLPVSVCLPCRDAVCALDLRLPPSPSRATTLFTRGHLPTIPPSPTLQHSTAERSPHSIPPRHSFKSLSLCNLRRPCAPGPTSRALSQRPSRRETQRSRSRLGRTLPYELRLLHHVYSASPDYAINSTRSHLVPLIRRPPCQKPTMSSIITVRHCSIVASSFPWRVTDHSL